MEKTQHIIFFYQYIIILKRTFDTDQGNFNANLTFTINMFLSNNENSKSNIIFLILKRCHQSSADICLCIFNPAV